MGVMSVREFHEKVSEALALVATGESLDIVQDGKVVAQLRPKPASRLDDPAFRAVYERLVKGLEIGVPGLTGPATYEERTGR